MYVRIDSSVKICMVRVRERLSADNRLQKYKIFSTYTNFYEEKFHFCQLSLPAHANYIHSECTA